VAGIRNANSYLGVHNLVDAIITCATSPRAANETFVLSDGLKLSTPELARQIAEALGIASRQFYWPESLFPISALKSSLALNSNKIVTRLNWSPPVSFRDGLKEVIEAFP
jgi:nucleoside-diphosphate-sugar epimerase